MLKKIMAVISILCVTVALVACGSKENTPKDTNNQQSEKQPAQQTQQTSTNEVKKSKLDSLKQSFKSAGLEVGENQTIAFDMINATNGYKFTINGGLIEIYEYDKDKLTDEGKKTLEQAKNGSITLSGLNIPVKCNDSVVIVRLDEHKDKDKILEVFNNFK